jgi:hypothetical protein
MERRGFKHRRTEDPFTIHGEYARNMQYVYSRQTQTRDGLVVDLVYFAADLLAEKIVIGLYRENTQMENSVYENGSVFIGLTKLSKESLSKELDKLISPLRDNFK